MTVRTYSEGNWLRLLTGRLDESTDVDIIGAAHATDPNLLRALAGRDIRYYATIDDAIGASARQDLVIDTFPVDEHELGNRLARLFSTLNEDGIAIIYLDTWPPKGEPVAKWLIGRHPGYSFRAMNSDPVLGSDSTTNIDVIRCTRRKPYAYLFLDPPFSGKSNAAIVLSEDTGLPMVCGDGMFAAIARGEYNVSQPFFNVAFDNRLVFSNPAWTGEFLDLIPQVADRQSFILDRAVPEDLWGNVIDAIGARGFRPIVCTLNHDAENTAAKKNARLSYLEWRDALLRDILNSRIWRWTAPVRWLGERVKNRKRA